MRYLGAVGGTARFASADVEYRDAERRGADLIGFGPIFATTSKRDPDPVVGVDGLRAVCAVVGIPVVAIGGITPASAAQVVAAGAPLAAAISALCGADDPRDAARRLHGALLEVASR